MTQRISLTLDDSSHDMLLRSGNSSAYLTALIKQRWHDWQSALALLVSCGWEKSTIIDACQRLNGVYDIDAENFIPVICVATGIEVIDRTREARALATLAAEYWAGNEWLLSTLNEDESYCSIRFYSRIAKKKRRDADAGNEVTE